MLLSQQKKTFDKRLCLVFRHFLHITFWWNVVLTLKLSAIFVSSHARTGTRSSNFRPSWFRFQVHRRSKPSSGLMKKYAKQLKLKNNFPKLCYLITLLRYSYHVKILISVEKNINFISNKLQKQALAHKGRDNRFQAPIFDSTSVFAEDFDFPEILRNYNHRNRKKIILTFNENI